MSRSNTVTISRSMGTFALGLVLALLAAPSAEAARPSLAQALAEPVSADAFRTVLEDATERDAAAFRALRDAGAFDDMTRALLEAHEREEAVVDGAVAAIEALAQQHSERFVLEHPYPEHKPGTAIRVSLEGLRWTPGERFAEVDVAVTFERVRIDPRVVDFHVVVDVLSMQVAESDWVPWPTDS